MLWGKSSMLWKSRGQWKIPGCCGKVQVVVEKLKGSGKVPGVEGVFQGSEKVQAFTALNFCV